MLNRDMMMGPQMGPQMGQPGGCQPLPQGCHAEPIVLPERVRCVHRYVCHEQPVITPIKTRVITHHVFKPCFHTTCCETHEEVCHKPEKPNCGCNEFEQRPGCCW